MFRSVSRDEADFISSHIQALYLGIYQGQIFWYFEAKQTLHSRPYRTMQV